MLAEQKSHSKVLDGVCVSHRKETKTEKMEEGGGTAGRREGAESGDGRVIRAHCIQIKDPEGRDLTETTQQDSGELEPGTQPLHPVTGSSCLCKLPSATTRIVGF